MSDVVSSGVQAYIERGKELAAAEAHRRATMRQMKFDTIAVHGIYGMEAALANQGSLNEPIYLSSAQHFECSDHMEAAVSLQMPGWIYTRIANPTVHYLEETLALMEGYGFDGEVSAYAAASGMGAVFIATSPFLMLDDSPIQNGHRSMARPNLVATPRCYGGTFMLFTERYAKERGVEVRWVPEPENIDAWAALIDDNTRFLYGELPSNPTLNVIDIQALADLAHQHNLPLIVDSTVATPALLRPLCHGADIVVHSVSKSMTVSGLGIAGAVVARHNIPSRVGPDELRKNFALYAKVLPARDFGPSISPFNAMMTINDLRTLRQRMDYISHNAMQVAQFLDQHPNVERVYYPGLANAEGHHLARRYMQLVDSNNGTGEAEHRYGHLVSFTVRGGVAACRAVLDQFQLIMRATDLGRIKSIATIPAISTHQQQGDGGRDLAGVPPHMIRLNVGGEHAADVIADLEQALAVAG
ncbi:MAG: O-acetylhomoserine aminocarboxypropyltransferase/cysteine synthase [Chloroflexaceae bacterium]|nr:O-acetylhomoserine aminocarboxypropyltransferase/cysteine synthase [Chloroflexaceae bacterium]